MSRWLMCPICEAGNYYDISKGVLSGLWCPNCDSNSMYYDFVEFTNKKLNGGDNMVKTSEIYIGKGNYLNSDTVVSEKLAGKPLTIKSADVELVGREGEAKQKIVLSFHETNKQLALNATNAKIMAEKYLDESDNWIGKIIQLIIIKTSFQEKLVPGIQVVPF